MANEPSLKRPASAAVEAFLAQAQQVTTRQATRGRLIFALDATQSRQPMWDLAQSLTARMFDAAGAAGGLDVQLVYFRGFDECRASRFLPDGRGLAASMAKITVAGGLTQIGKVLGHIRDEARRSPTRAFIYIGDACEEPVDLLCSKAGELGLLGVKGFFFQEGASGDAAHAFRELARLTGGAYAAFDSGAADALAALLGAVAVYAAGGRLALESRARSNAGGNGGAAALLLSQLR